VARITIGIGVVLIVFGLVGYFPDLESWTALIPAFVGVLLAVLGVVALDDRRRKHAMHAAVIVGLLGFLAAAARAIPVALSGEIKNPKAFTMVVAMAVTCGVFVALCVKSFIDARRQRQQTPV
jgi:drug/metabolite transporter (DMT)-like permease